MADVFLFDTNIATAVWNTRDKYHEQAHSYLSNLGGINANTIKISVVTLAEVRCGLRTAQNMPDEQRTAVQDAMDRYPVVLPITEHTAEYYSKIRSKLFIDHSPRNERGRLTRRWVEDLTDSTTEKSLGIQTNDIWIAAQAMEKNLVLVTADQMRHIASLQLNPGLRIVYWR